MNSHYIVLFFLLLGVRFTQAQTITGRIINELDQPVPDALVYVLSSDSARIMTITTTDSNGIWNIKLSHNEDVLKFEALGFEEKYEKVSLFMFPDSIRTTTMPFRKNMLPEVEINERRIGIVLSGDTLIYDVNAYSKSGDRTLRDVLSSMPGLSVDSDGMMYYNERKIDKLLLDGKDILQNQHRLTAESFLIKDVSKIQVIEQYASFKDILSGRYSELIAMNIVLKEEAKSKLNGEAEVMAGYNDRAVLKTNQFFVGKKTSVNSFLRSDNTGQAVFTSMDFLGLQSSLSRSLTQAGGDISAILPESFIKPQDIVKNRESVISTAWIHQPNKTVSCHFSITGFYASREFGHIFLKNYFLSQNIISGKTKSIQKTPVVYAVANTRLAIKPNLHLEIEVPIEWGRIREESSMDGTVDERLFANQLSGKKSHYTIFPQYYLSGTLKEKWYYKISQSYFVKQNSGDLAIQDSSGIFMENVMGLDQQTIRTSRNFNTSVLLEKEFKQHRFAFFYHFMNPEETFNTTRNPFITGIQEGRQSIVDVIHEPGLSYELKTDVWWINFSGSAKNIRREDEWAGRTERTFVGLAMKIRFNFSRFHYILVKGKVDKNLPGQATVRKTEEVTDGQTIHSGRISSLKGVTAKSTSLLYVFLLPGAKKRYQLQFEFSDIADPVIAGSVSEQQSILMLYFRAKRSLMFFTNNSFEYPLGKFWMTNIKAMYSVQNQIINHDRNFKIQNLGLSFLLSSNYKKLLNVELLLKANQQTFLSELLSNDFKTFECAAKVIFQKNKIRMEQEVSWNQQYAENFSFRNNFLKINYTWDIKMKNQWTLVFKGIDVMNILPMRVSEGLFADQFTGFKLFNRFPGSIIVGVRATL